MTLYPNHTKARFALATATAMVASIAAVTVPATSVFAQATSQRAVGDMALSIGRAQIVNLAQPITDIVISNERVIDVQVRSPRQIYVFAKGSGESSFFATNKDGQVVYSANVRVGQNVNSVDEMLRTAMPEAQIKATQMNGLVLLTGTVESPDDGAEAERLVKAYMGDDMQVISRLKTATPLQVNLQVKIAEVNRDFVKKLGVNLMNQDATGGFLFGVAQGRNFGSITSSAAGTTFNMSGLSTGSGTTLGLAGKLLGLDLLTAIDLAETNGMATTLAQPNLTALSGETASFLAGGEIPIPIAQGQGQVSVEFKQYGVSLAFTPFVMSNGRISMRVRPEVSQLSFSSAVTVNGFSVPGLSTRRTETTVELGSGQSFMIGGLLMSSHNNSVDKAPGLGDLPILGTLFRSNTFRRNETELVIVVTPYLVKPVSANEIALPTDGYKAPTDAERVFMGRLYSGKSGQEDRPVPTMGDPVMIPAPSVGEGPSQQANKPSKRKKKKSASAEDALPGFGL